VSDAFTCIRLFCAAAGAGNTGFLLSPARDTKGMITAVLIH